MIIFLLSLKASSLTGSAARAREERLACFLPLGTLHLLYEGGGLTLQNPVDLSALGQPLQVHGHGRQVGPVLLQGLAAAAVQLDGPLWRTD